MQNISEGYGQLAVIFAVLETARFIPDTDFGANPAASYQWYLSPSAKEFLDRRNIPEWAFIQDNQQFSITFNDWEGKKGQGAIIQLKLVGVSAKNT